MQLHSESAMELDFDQAIPRAGHAPALFLRPWKWFQHNQIIRRQNSTNMIVGFVIAGAIVLLVSYLHTTGFFNDPQQELLSYAGFSSLLSPTASPPLTLPATPNLSPHPQPSRPHESPPHPMNLSSFNSTVTNVSMTTGTTTTTTIPQPNPRSEAPPPLSKILTLPPLNPTPALTPLPPDPTPPPPVAAGGSNSNNTTGFDDWNLNGAPSPAPEECNDLVVYYQNMSVTWHRMGDEELLRKALEVDAARTLQLTSSSEQVNEPSRGEPAGIPRIAYMFLTRGAMPFAPLWDRYFRGHQELHSIYVHAHPRYVPDFPPHSPFFRRFVPSEEVRWGRLSLYEAERRLLGNALLDPTNEWFLLLSDSCIPLDTFPNTYKYITESRKSFIEAYMEPKVKAGRGRGRGRGRLYRNEYQQMEPEITLKNFRKGSQWFQIHRHLAVTATADTRYYPKFAKHFCAPRPVCYIDEHYLPTLAFTLSPKAIAYRTLTYFSFPRNGPHPRMWDNTTTSNRLINWFREGHNCTYNGALSSRCYFFVRKFHPNALDILLGIAHESMGIP